MMQLIRQIYNKEEILVDSMYLSQLSGNIELLQKGVRPNLRFGQLILKDANIDITDAKQEPTHIVYPTIYINSAKTNSVNIKNMDLFELIHDVDAHGTVGNGNWIISNEGDDIINVMGNMIPLPVFVKYLKPPLSHLTSADVTVTLHAEKVENMYKTQLMCGIENAQVSNDLKKSGIINRVLSVLDTTPVTVNEIYLKEEDFKMDVLSDTISKKLRAITTRNIDKKKEKIKENLSKKLEMTKERQREWKEAVRSFREPKEPIIRD
eukprot:TRINITY_DN5345_c0_g1_i3.p1 TRINITY_DN5345_c0_g1~~TRINITY_DN5345_c0_g1_i3.p1  ORF type:complete len:265 (-),score=60.49 TRINITY_DN5345_c0_g1_i3:54-848(-)